MSADPVCFLDSNIWLYALNRRQDEVKHQVARSLATRPGLWISTQVINEVCKNLIQKANFDEHQTTQIIIAFYNRCQVAVLSRATLLKASELRTRYQFSYWDSLILAAALSSGADILYSEDMQHGLKVEAQLIITNPFL